jgi:plasmid stabilization system protein ParE
MAKRLIWSKSASKEFLRILKYWDMRNQSSVYSQKLRKKIKETFQLICENSYLGRPTSKSGVRFTLCDNYLLYYKISENRILILSISDGRRNPNRLIYK